MTTGLQDKAETKLCLVILNGRSALQSFSSARPARHLITLQPFRASVWPLDTTGPTATECILHCSVIALGLAGIAAVDLQFGTVKRSAKQRKIVADKLSDRPRSPRVVVVGY